jgi:hypothetical protein
VCLIGILSLVIVRACEAQKTQRAMYASRLLAEPEMRQTAKNAARTQISRSRIGVENAGVGGFSMPA